MIDCAGRPMSLVLGIMSLPAVHWRPAMARGLATVRDGDRGGERIMASAGEAQGDGVRDRAPSRVIIAGVSPEVDSGRFPIKRTVGEELVVAADIFGDGHDVIVAVLRHRSTGATGWDEVPMTLLANDRWTGRFTVTARGWHEYTIQAWVDRYLTWHKELIKKHEAGQQDLSTELLEGAEQLREAAERANGPDADWLRERARFLAGTESQESRVRAGLKILDEIIKKVMV